MTCEPTTSHAAEVDSTAHVAKAEAIASRGRDAVESITRLGRQQMQITGKLHKFVDPLSGPRISRNSFEVSEVNGKLVYTLKYGLGRLLIVIVDSTASFNDWFSATFVQSGLCVGFAHKVHKDQNDQIIIMLVQDEDDDKYRVGEYEWLPYGRKVALMASMAESNEITILDQSQNFLPGLNGKDYPEAYQLALAQAYFGTEAQCIAYNVKPDLYMIGDDKGRSKVYREDALAHLGIDIGQDISTRELAAELVKKVNVTFFNVNEDVETTAWWTETIGHGRVVFISDARHLAAQQAAITYWRSSADATPDLMRQFIMDGSRGTKYAMRLSDANTIVENILNAGIQSGTDVVGEIPQPGDKFDHPNAYWPVGHPRYQPWDKQGLPNPRSEFKTKFTPISEAIMGAAFQTESGLSVVTTDVPTTTPKQPKKPTNWKNF